jgi:hypothetical protein
MSRTLTPEQRLQKKLFEVRKKAVAVAKEGHNGNGNFAFARFEDVIAEASRLLDEKRIFWAGEVVDEAIRVFGNMAIAKVAMEFEVIDLSGGGCLVKRWSGSADDKPGGKALFKAQTGCEKYFLAKLLRIPFGTDPEEDTGAAAAETGGDSSTYHHIPEQDEADRVRAQQDQAAEAPQVSPRHKKPLPSSDLPEPDYTGLIETTEEVGASA